jgi:hypothetical protein
MISFSILLSEAGFNVRRRVNPNARQLDPNATEVSGPSRTGGAVRSSGPQRVSQSEYKPDSDTRIANKLQRHATKNNDLDDEHKFGQVAVKKLTKLKNEW